MLARRPHPVVPRHGAHVHRRRLVRLGRRQRERHVAGVVARLQDVMVPGEVGIGSGVGRLREIDRLDRARGPLRARSARAACASGGAAARSIARAPRRQRDDQDSTDGCASRPPSRRIPGPAYADYFDERPFRTTTLRRPRARDGRSGPDAAASPTRSRRAPPDSPTDRAAPTRSGLPRSSSTGSPSDRGARRPT